MEIMMWDFIFVRRQPWQAIRTSPCRWELCMIYRLVFLFSAGLMMKEEYWQSLMRMSRQVKKERHQSLRLRWVEKGFQKNQSQVALRQAPTIYIGAGRVTQK